MRAKKGEEPQMVYEYSMEKYNTYDSEVADRVIGLHQAPGQRTGTLLCHLLGKGNHFWGAHPDFRDTPAQTNTASQMVEHDYNVGRVIKTLID